MTRNTRHYTPSQTLSDQMITEANMIRRENGEAQRRRFIDPDRNLKSMRFIDAENQLILKSKYSLMYIHKELEYLNFLNIYNLEILRIETHLFGTNIIMCGYRYFVLLLASCAGLGIVCCCRYRVLLQASCAVTRHRARLSASCVVAQHRARLSASCMILGIMCGYRHRA